MEDIYLNYQSVMKSLDTKNKEARGKIEEYRNQLNQGGTNTQGIESEIQNNIDYLNDSHKKLENGYSNRNAPSTIPGGELDKRQKEIQSLKSSINQLTELFDSVKNIKYGYKVDARFLGEYKQTDEMKNMSNKELISAQKEKIKQQDKQLEDIANDVVIGDKLAKEFNHELKEQNKQLDDIQKDIDKLDSRMNRMTKRFENYVAKQSGCKIIITLVIEAVIAGVIYLVMS